MRKVHLGFGASALLGLLLLGQPTAGIAASTSTKKAEKPKEGKRSSENQPVPLATPVVEQATVSSAANSGVSADFQSPLKSPGARDVRMNSVKSEQNAASSLSGPSRDQLLREASPSSFQGGNAAVVQSAQPGVASKRVSGLKLGTFRSETLTAGYVAPPGITDFAAYFRARSPALKAKIAEGAATEPVRPGEMSDDELARQTAAEQLRVQTVASIRQVLAQKPAVDQKIDLMMRLAEIQVERHAFALELEIRAFNKAHDKWAQNGAGDRGGEPLFKTDKSDRILLTAVENLRQIVNSHPDHQRTPEALFTLGFLLLQVRSDSAEIYFDRLVKRFPQSALVPEANLALGEFYFSRMKFDKALDAYLKIVGGFRDKAPRAYDYAVYKVGWTWFNKRDGGDEQVKKNLGKSLAAFKLIVKRASEFPQEKVLQDLRRDALKDMVLVFVDLGDVSGAESFYEGLNEPELFLNMLERLAWQYSESGEFEKSAGIYQRVLQEASLHQRLPEFYAKLAELFARQGQYDKMIAAQQQMSQTLSIQGPWVKRFSTNTAAMELWKKSLVGQLRGWAEKLHAEGQKGKGEKRFDEALMLYGLYLENFGEKAESYSSHFYRADILARKGRYLEAAEGYQRAASLDEQFSLRGKYSNTALVNAIAVLDRLLEKAPQPRLPEAGKATEKIPLTMLHERITRAIDQFVRMFPTDNQLLEFSHRAARIAYAFGDYPGARTRWLTLAQRFPKSNEVYDGLRLVLRVFVDRKDWDTSIGESRQFLAITGVRGTKLGNDLVEVLKAATFAKAMVHEQKEQYQEASNLFLAYHREFRQDAEAPKALFNAANNRFKQGKVDEAITTLRILLAQYPDSPLVQNGHYLIASAYDALGRFSDSAASYEMLARDFPKNPVAVDALLRAAEERFATFDYEIAIRDANEFISRFPTHTSVGQAWMLVGRSHLKMNHRVEAIAAFARGAETLQTAKPELAMLLVGLAADTALKEGDKGRAAQLCDSGVAQMTRLSEKTKAGVALEGVRLVAQTKFELLDDRLPALTSRTIADGGQLVPEFTKIRTDAEVLSNAYEGVLRLGNAEAGIAALYRIAEIQEFLASILNNAPAPVGAKPEAVEEFKSKVEKLALERQEDATNYYLTAWQKAGETEAITPFVRRIHEKLMVLKPEEFRRVTTEMPGPAYFSSEIVVESETSKVIK
jgi:TolA-binding protein